MRKLINYLMGRIAVRKFVPTPEEVKAEGAVPMNQEEIIEALKRYATQNPAKYAAKKEALFKQYGLTDNEATLVEEQVAEPEIKAKKAKKDESES